MDKDFTIHFYEGRKLLNRTGGRAETNLTIAVLFVLLLAIGSLGILTVRLIDDFGEDTAARNETSSRTLTETFLVRIARERAERCGQFFRQAEVLSAKTANLAASFLANINLYGKQNLNPNESFDKNQKNGFFSNAATERVNVLLCCDGIFPVDMEQQINALSHLDPVLEQTQSSDPSYIASWILREFGVGSAGIVRNYPNTHYIDILPPLDVVNPLEAPYYVIATPRLNPERAPKWSEVYEDDTGNGLVMTVATPIYVTDAFLGVAGLDVSLDNILKCALEAGTAATGAVGFSSEFSFLVRSDGNLIASSPGKLPLLGLGMSDRERKPAETLSLRLDSSEEPSVHALAKVMRQSRDGVQTISLGDQRYLVAFAALPSPDWILAVAVAESDYLGSVWAMLAELGRAEGVLLRRFIIASSVACACVAAVIFLFFRINLLKPLNELASAMRRFSAGEFQPSPALGSARNEIGELVETFREMTQSVRAGRARLEAAERKYRGIFENAIEGIFQLDANGRVVSANQALSAMLGFTSPEEIVSIRQVVEAHNQRGSDYIDLWGPLQGTGKVDNFETSLQRSDGTTIWVCASVRAVRDEQGNVAGYEGMLLDVSERKEKEAAEKAQREAEAANQAKSDFLASMSHEIRTPLNAILGATEQLQETWLDPEQQKCLRLLRGAGDSLLSLIEDILDLSRIEAGHLDLDCVEFDVREVMARCVSVTAATAVNKDLAVDWSLEGEPPTRLLGDPIRLGQILINLLGNGVKFTESGSVRLSAAASSAEPPSGQVELLFSVEDTGVGVAPELQERVFERFTQANGSATRRHGGAGLGLAIAKRLTELMGGRIWLESEPGQGSVFRFTARFGLPGAQTASASLGAETVRPIPATIRARPRLLIADDSEDNRTLIEFFLRQTPYELTMAENGLQAVERYRQGAFDAVLLDMQMPIMDGYEAVRRIREDERARSAPAVPVIALTAYAMKDDERKCLEAGCSAYLSKPIKKAVLLEALRQWVGPA